MADARDLAFLAALQLGDAFLPTGAYTLSQGLESMVQLGWVTSAASLEVALRSYLAEQLGPADAVAVASTQRALEMAKIDEVVMIDRYLDALKLARESREGSRRTGRNLLQALGAITEDGLPADYRRAVDAGLAPGHHAVVLGLAGRLLGLSVRESALVFLYASTVGVLGAALRLMRLDHLTTQAILSRLRPDLAALAASAEVRPWRAMRTFAPQLEVAAMAHERARVRLFTS